MITARSGEVSKPQECVLKLTYEDKHQQIWEYLLYQLNHWGPVFCVYISELDYYSVKSVSPDHHQVHWIKWTHLYVFWDENNSKSVGIKCRLQKYFWTVFCKVLTIVVTLLCDKGCFVQHRKWVFVKCTVHPLPVEYSLRSILLSTFHVNI